MSRFAFELVDRIGGVHPVGEMCTPRSNDLGEPILRERYEVFDLVRNLWVAAPWSIVRELRRMSKVKREATLRKLHRGLRAISDPDNVRDAATGEHYAVPVDYDVDLNRKLDKAIQSGQITLGGRTVKVLSKTLTGAYLIRSAAGEHRWTRAALLEAMAQNIF